MSSFKKHYCEYTQVYFLLLFCFLNLIENSFSSAFEKEIERKRNTKIKYIKKNFAYLFFSLAFLFCLRYLHLMYVMYAIYICM